MDVTHCGVLEVEAFVVAFPLQDDCIFLQGFLNTGPSGFRDMYEYEILDVTYHCNG